jgi:hypothetical protein
VGEIMKPRKREMNEFWDKNWWQKQDMIVDVTFTGRRCHYKKHKD